MIKTSNSRMLTRLNRAPITAALLLAGFMAAPPIRAADKPAPAIDLATLPERAARNYPASQEPFEQILKLRETGNAAAVPALTKVMAADVLTGRIHGYAASQALFHIGTPEAHEQLAKYLFDPQYRAAAGIGYTFHWNMAEPARSRFIDQYHLVNLAKDLTLELASRVPAGEKDRIEFTVTLKNIGDQPLQLIKDPVYLAGLLHFRAADGHYFRGMETVEYKLALPTWLTLPLGATHTYQIEAKIEDGDRLALTTDDMRFDLGQPGQFTVVAMLEAPPRTPEQLTAAQLTNAWSGRAVSKPIGVLLPPAVKAVERATQLTANHDQFRLSLRGDPTATELVHLLADQNQGRRTEAATTLRLLLANNPSAAPNRHEQKFWEGQLARVKPGMTEEEAIQILLPDATPDERRQARGFDSWAMGGGSVSYRLDDYWTVTLPLVGDLSNAKVSRDKAPVLTPSVRWFQLSQPANYTGTWTTYFANGQKAAEIQYRDGKPDGAFINCHDNGAKKIEQHYVGGVEHGLDTGWHPNGQKAYEGRYDNYKPVGTWRWWDATGKLTREEDRGPAVETLERETTIIQHSKKQDDAPWGEAVEGVQVRLRADKTVWAAGEVPELKVDARNNGDRKLYAPHSHRLFDLELDGRLYSWGGSIDEMSSEFSAARPRDNIPLPLGTGWLPKNGNLTLTQLPLTPGKHTVRVILTADPVDQDKGRVVRAVSNPVEIEVQERKDGAAEAVPPTAPSPLELPGHEASLIQVAAVRNAVAVRCEATTDPKEQFGHSGVCHVEQAFRIVESLVGKPPATSGVQVVYAYLYPPHFTQRAIRKGETVIWVMEQEAGRYRGFQALADSAANRTLVCDTLTPLTPARRQALLITQLSAAPNGWRTEEMVRWALRDVSRVTAKFRGFPVAAGTPGAVVCEDGKHRVETSFTLVRDAAGPAPEEWVRRFMTLIAGGHRIVELATEDAPRAGMDRTTTPVSTIAASKAEGWSEVNEGMRGRLVIAQPKIAANGWLRATLELENVGQTPLTVFTGYPRLLKASITDGAGKPVAPTNVRSDVLMSPQPVVIEPGRRLSLPVTIESLDGAKGSQVDTTTQIWKLPPGQYVLGGAYGWDAIEESPRRGTWLGRLSLPAVPFEVVATAAGPPAARVLAPFYRNGWHGWPTGTEVRTTFLDDKVDGWYSYVQPGLTCRVTSNGLVRTQMVNGKPTEQQLNAGTPDHGTFGPASLHRIEKGVPVTLDVGGVQVDCLVFESAIEKRLAHTDGSFSTAMVVQKEWVLADQPTIWLRTEANQNYKVIKSLREMRQVGDRQVACVVVEERMEMSGGHQITTSWLSPEVPGHVVEKISQTWFEGRQQRSHERVAEMRSARGVGETKPGP